MSKGTVFSIRGSVGIEKTMTVEDEREGSLVVRVVTKSPWGVLESDEILSRELFDSCLRTGFIRRLDAASA